MHIELTCLEQFTGITKYFLAKHRNNIHCLIKQQTYAITSNTVTCSIIVVNKYVSLLQAKPFPSKNTNSRLGRGS